MTTAAIKYSSRNRRARLRRARSRKRYSAKWNQATGALTQKPFLRATVAQFSSSNLLGDAGGLYPAMSSRDQVSKSNECAQAATIVIRSLYHKMGHASPRCNKLGLMVRLIHLTRQRVVNKATGSGRGKSGSG